jgi:hypothetical protein
VLTSVFLRDTLEVRIEEVHVPKSDLPIGPEYAPVADRIALFYERFPEGRIITQLTMHNEHEIVFQASVYRGETSRVPAATGWASERIGDGDINTVACLENTETSAIGRALANLGFTASKNRPSAEEMAKAARARSARDGSGEMRPNDTVAIRTFRVAEPVPIVTPLQTRADAVSDALSILATARRLGFPPRRAHVIARALTRPDSDDGLVPRVTRRLREWTAGRASKAWPPAPSTQPRSVDVP